ncbi:MAG: formylglycine-generating enzyme family protein [Acidobacteria bacterium]|nr:formylglycine-generating enzyme family protein [Acidobacteriota bacterium]
MSKPSCICSGRALPGIPLVAMAVLTLAGVWAACTHSPHPAGSVFRDCPACPEMVIVPPGAFVMGSPATEKGREADEGQHAVTIGHSFAVSKGPVTWDQWEECVRSRACDGASVEAALRLDRDGTPTGNLADPPRGHHPVTGVSWLDARDHIRWLNDRTGEGTYRLLSESEFEYAARAGSTTVYGWGDQPSHEHANYGEDAAGEMGGKAEGRDRWENSTSPVCSFPANPFGLCDMYGNVYQWVEDCYEPDGARLPADGSAVENGDCSVRGFRSNSFESTEVTLRSANRAYVYAPDTRGRGYLGFRVAKTLR